MSHGSDPPAMPHALSPAEQTPPRASRPRRWVRALQFLLAVAALLLSAALMWYGVTEDSLALHAGEVAPRDVLAPYTHTFTSQVLTQQKREAAAQAITKVYAPPDTSISRRQLARLRAALALISAIRADPYATPEQKRHDLAAIQGLHLTPDDARALLTLDDKTWEKIQHEALRVLETMMRSPIREDRLDEARRNIPAFIDLTLPEKQASLVQRLVAAYLAPNSLYSPQLTEAARQRAKERVLPVQRTIHRGETIVQRGQVLTPADIEALKEYGLLQGTARWQALVSPLILTLAAYVLLTLYLALRRPQILGSFRRFTLLLAASVLTLAGARLLLVGHTVLPYLYPFATLSLLLFLLFDAETALALTVPILGLSLYQTPHGAELLLYHLFISLSGVVLLSRAQRISTFVSAALGMAVSGSMVILAFRLPSPSTDFNGLLTLLAAAASNGVLAAALALLLHYFLAPWLGKITQLQLLELSRPDQPLLQRLLQEAPGTYQHSLQVANLADQAARAIGADALLVRVGALYHDIGKVVAPQYYIENQPPQAPSPHQNLTPEESARIIIQHVPEGLRLAREHGLPRRIQDFIAEHHGTMLTGYQYARALEEAKKRQTPVDPAAFRYPGPPPRSRETALVMLADACEARTRAERPPDEQALRRLVRETITDRIRAGQLSDTDLTLRDLRTVEDAFVAALQGVYHPRIRYPRVLGGQKTIPVRDQALPPGEEAPAADLPAETAHSR